jgi:NAD-dependent dihydropyrimidine dehydrogenase PreA subunit
MAVVYVDEKRCTGCGLCTDVCVPDAISVLNGVARVEQSLCVGCEACLSVCPTGAILSLTEPANAEKLTPVYVPAPAPVPVQPITPTTQSGDGVWPWMGAALGFVVREVVPRVATILGNLSRRSRIDGVPYDAMGAHGSRNYRGRGGGRRARRRRRGR